MSTTKPRIQVTVTPEQYAVISRFASVIGQSRSSLLSEMVQEMTPVWEKLAESLELAKSIQEGAKQGWKEGVLAQLTPAELELESIKDQALQLIVGTLDHFENSVREAAAGGEAGGARSATAAPHRKPNPRTCNNGGSHG